MVSHNLFFIHFKKRYDTDGCSASTFLNMSAATPTRIKYEKLVDSATLNI